MSALEGNVLQNSPGFRLLAVIEGVRLAVAAQEQHQRLGTYA